MDGPRDSAHFLLGKTASVRSLIDIALIARASENVFTGALPSPMTSAQYAVLQYLVNFEKKPTITSLAEILCVSQPTMSSTIRRLALRGLVEIVPSKRDRRAKAVTLTDAGRAMKEECDTAMLPTLRDMAQLVDQDMWSELSPLLRKLRTKLLAAYS